MDRMMRTYELDDTFQFNLYEITPVYQNQIRNDLMVSYDSLKIELSLLCYQYFHISVSLQLYLSPLQIKKIFN